MLKRYQVLLPDWLGEYVEHLVGKYDLSFSEIIRTEICCAVLAAMTHLYPEYKPGITHEEISLLMKNEAQKSMERDEVHRILSKIYFETRKAVEFRLDKERKNIKKTKKKKK